MPLYINLIGFFRTLTPSFSKISRVLLVEKQLSEIKNEEIKKLSERSQYVNRANKTMHYMRNRLGPFSNLIKMIDNLNIIPEEKLDRFNELLVKENDRAKIELTNITDRAKEMLEKSANPYLYANLKQISIERVYTILKRNYYSFFPDSELTIDIIPTEDKIKVNLNEEGFEIFLSDWLNNMFKYRINKIECIYKIENGNLLISFLNDHNKSNEEINQMISDLTSNERNEIMKRTTHGLYIIKTTLEDMNVNFELKNDETSKILVLTIKIKLVENENRGI